MMLPWIEKHRPSEIENIILNPHLKQFIKKIVDEKNMPNIILEGHSGVGKTSTIRCIAKELYKEQYDFMVSEMNASDDRGKKIYETINIFRKTFVEPKDKIPTFKLIILDEADNMTEPAQNIISNFMKNYTNDIKFAFTCNEKEGIGIPIQNCCHVLKYPRMTNEQIIQKLKNVCEIENIIINTETNEGLKTIAILSEKDMRKAINMLQVLYNTYGRISKKDILNEKPQLSFSFEIIKLCYYEKNLSGAIKIVMEMKEKGYSGTDITSGIKYALLDDMCSDISEYIKNKIWSCCEYTIICIAKGLDTSIIQVVSLICDIYDKIKDDD